MWQFCSMAWMSCTYIRNDADVIYGAQLFNSLSWLKRYIFEEHKPILKHIYYCTNVDMYKHTVRPQSTCGFIDYEITNCSGMQGQ